jgi:hypothetical protein
LKIFENPVIMMVRDSNKRLFVQKWEPVRRNGLGPN